MINPKIEKAFNDQINAELYSAYIYLSMAAYFDAKNFSGMATWMKRQADEEMEHAMKFYSYIIDNGGKVHFKAIEAPPKTWKSTLEVFNTAYKHECKVTKLIHMLVDLAKKLNDHAASIFLQWFVTEQIEEEATASSIVDKLKLIKENGAALLMLDHELGKRE